MWICFFPNVCVGRPSTFLKQMVLLVESKLNWNWKTFNLQEPLRRSHGPTIIEIKVK